MESASGQSRVKWHEASVVCFGDSRERLSRLVVCNDKGYTV